MNLDGATCLDRIDAAGHGVLATVNPRRAVDAVPVVFALSDGKILIPIDAVKPKRSTDLQRVRNLKHDPRCVLLVENYSDNWEELWWVRVHAHAEVMDADPTGLTDDTLAAKYPQYRCAGSIIGVITLTPDAITGWQARAEPPHQ